MGWRWGFHVFHYIGHGEYDERTGGGCLVLEWADGRPHYVSGDQLGAVLCDRHTIRLAVLNACEAATTAKHDPLAGVAAALVEYNIPAVIGMQFAITDAAAVVFVEELYATLADGYPIDAAVTEARRALAADSDVEWATPVLFMRVNDGRPFDLSRSPAAHAAGTVSPQGIQPAVEDPSSPLVDPGPEAVAAASQPGLLDTKSPRISSKTPLPSTPSALRRGLEVTRVVTKKVWSRHIFFDVAFSPDGGRIATAGGKTARAWDSESGHELTRVHDAKVVGVAFSPDGGRIATAGLDQATRVWQVQDTMV